MRRALAVCGYILVHAFLGAVGALAALAVVRAPEEEAAMTESHRLALLALLKALEWQPRTSEGADGYTEYDYVCPVCGRRRAARYPISGTKTWASGVHDECAMAAAIEALEKP